MQKISDSTSTANAAGEFTEGNPAAGAAATLLKAAWLNAIQRELVTLIQASGLVLNPADDTQLLKAVKALAAVAADWKTLSNKPTTVAESGITDALVKGQFGLGGTIAATQGIDFVGLAGGFYYFGEGGTSFANNVGLVNIPYGTDSYAGQLGFQQGTADPKIFVRSCKSSKAWGPTRELWHSGSFDPTLKADKAATDAALNLKAPLASPSFTGTPYAPTAAPGTNNGQLANTAFVQAALSALVGAAPGALDTLKELADALGGDPNFATTITNALSAKLAIGQYGLGGTTAPQAGVDFVGLPGGFYYYGDGPTTLANNVGVLNIPYGVNTFAAQIAFRQGLLEPDIYVRGCRLPGVWGNTRKVWHSGNLDPNAILPTGTTIAFAGPTVPIGFLKENGAAVSRTAYADLFAVIGTTYGAGNGTTTFNVPDSRGEFVRGADDGRGIDPGRAVGSWQDSQNKDHSHLYGAVHSTNYGLSGTGIAGVSPGQVQYATSSSGGGEARPRSTARLMCIKY